MKDFYTDEEFAQLSGGTTTTAPDFISDEEMVKMEQNNYVDTSTADNKTVSTVMDLYNKKKAKEDAVKTLTPDIKKVPIMGNIVKSAEAGINKVAQGGENVNQGIQNKSITQIGRGLLQGASGALETFFSPVTGAIESIGNAPVIKQGVEATNKYIVQPAIDKISESKTLQKFVMDNPNAEQVAGDVINVGSAFIGGKKSPAIKTAVEESGAKLTSKVAEIGQKRADTAFVNESSKVFPTLKKDVPLMAKKSDNIYTAFKDIADNKNTLGLTDDGVNFRSPKTFAETVEAQNKRLPELYKQYTEKLQGIDKTKFEEAIHNGIFDEMDAIKAKLEKENSIDNRKVLNKIYNEIGSLRDPSPMGIQDYIQTINQKIKPAAPGGALTLEQVQYANLAGKLRTILDNAVEKTGGAGYQELRNVYAAHKQIQSQLLMAARKEINKTSNLLDRFADVGLTYEGLNYLITQNPIALARAIGIKSAVKYINWIRSPQKSLQKVFKQLDKGYLKTPKPLSPKNTQPIAITSNKNAMPSIVPRKGQSGKTTAATVAGLGAATFGLGGSPKTKETTPINIPQPKQSIKPPFDVNEFKTEVVKRENSGNPDSYSIVGVTGDLGKYQVKKETLAAYSDDFLGRKVTPAEFLRSPDLQEKFFEGFLNHMAKKSVREPRLNDPKILLALWHRGFGDLRKERLDRLLSEPESIKYIQ